MTQEDKQLLIKDLCARLPYGTYVHHKNVPDTKFKVIAVFDDGRIGVTENEIPLTPTSINECKPYLRSMSSITMEEIRYKLSKFFKIINTNIEGIGYVPTLNSGSAIEYINWLNEKHFDYNGLIEKGIALEAPDGMYE